MRRSYSIHVIAKLITALLVGAFIVVGIYLTEELVGLLRLIGEAQAAVSTLWYMLALIAPNILDVAMPLATLIAMYRILLEAREQRELVVLAASSVGAQHFLRLLAIGACISASLTLAVSGFLEPSTRHEYRSKVFELFHASVSGGLPAEKIFHFGTNTVINRAKDRADGIHRLFLVEQVPGNPDRVITAERSLLAGPDPAGDYSLHIRDFLLHTIPEDQGPEDQGPDDQREGMFDTMRTWEANRLVYQVALSRFLNFPPRRRFIEEWSTPELLNFDPPGRQTDAHLREAAVRIVRGLLCFLAPVLAVFALALTWQRTQIVTLPVACGQILFIDFIVQHVISKVPAFSILSVVLSAVAVCFLIMLGWVAAWVISGHASFIKPQLED